MATEKLKKQRMETVKVNLTMLSCKINGKTFGAATCNVTIGQSPGIPAIAVRAGRKRLISTTASTLEFLTTNGCPFPLAAALIMDAIRKSRGEKAGELGVNFEHPLAQFVVNCRENYKHFKKGFWARRQVIDAMLDPQQANFLDEQVDRCARMIKACNEVGTAFVIDWDKIPL